MPAERSLGAHAARVIRVGTAWSVGFEGAVATSAGIQITRVCLLSPNTPCDTRELGQTVEVKAVGTIRPPGQPWYLTPHLVAGAGLYATRGSDGAAWNAQGTRIHDGKGLGPAGLVVEGGAGLTLIPGHNPLGVELLVRNYGNAPHRHRNTYLVRLAVAW